MRDIIHKLPHSDSTKLTSTICSTLVIVSGLAAPCFALVLRKIAVTVPATSFLASFMPFPLRELLRVDEISTMDECSAFLAANSRARAEANYKVYRQDRISPPVEVTNWCNIEDPPKTERRSSMRTFRRRATRRFSEGEETSNC